MRKVQRFRGCTGSLRTCCAIRFVSSGSRTGHGEAVEQRLSLPDVALRAIGELPEGERELLDLRVVQERSYWEIAARLRCTPQAARLRVSRTLRRLNLALGGERR